MKKQHESYGMIQVSKYTGTSDFYGSDIKHNNGITITISKSSVERDLSRERFSQEKELIQIDMSNNQFVDAITSGMNTTGVPCTIKSINGERINQIKHIEDKKFLFMDEMDTTQKEFINRISDIEKLLEGNIEKRKSDEIKHQLKILKSHISSNTNFVMNQFEESMEKVVTESKHSISSYIDQKIISTGLESMRDELTIGLNDKNKIGE